MGIDLENSSPGTLSRRRFLLGASAVSGLALYSGEVSRHAVEVVELTIPIRNLPEAFHGYRIVQISDLHLEEFTEPSFLRHVLDRVNSIPSDLVLITGDFISKAPLSKPFAIRQAGICGEMLRQIACPLRYGILGNHDLEVGAAAVADQLRTTGTPILINQHLALERGGDHIWLCGVSEEVRERWVFAKTVPNTGDAPVIVMVHEPDYMDDLMKHPNGQFVDLVLGGHSHGGQIRLPGLPPFALPPGAVKYYDGLYHFGNARLYVNRGIGTVGIPFRLFCPPEITVFTLQPKLPA